MEAQYGQNIRKVRKALKLTQEEFAQKCGISLTSLRRYEANERQPNIATIENMAKSLNMTLGEFLWSIDDSSTLAKQRLLTVFDQLNDEGQCKAVARVEELTEIPKYQKEKEPPQPE